MNYNSNIPQPGDFLSQSQQDILNNFSSSNTTFGIDHYAFNDRSGNAGKHNKITTPIITGTQSPTTPPTTAVNEPIFYCLAPYASIGALQYSRGGNNAVPTPLTTLQSPEDGIEIDASTNSVILDFTGINLAYFNVYAVGSYNTTLSLNQSFGYWNGSAFNVKSIYQLLSFFYISTSGTQLLLVNNSSTANLTSVYWTLQFLRIV